MSDLESRLHAALRADAPPERDALFRLDVLARRERATFIRQLAVTVAAVLAAAVLTAMHARQDGTWTGVDATQLAIVAAALAALPGAPFMALPGVRKLAQEVERWFFA
jgi:hypothetical protein